MAPGSGAEDGGTRDDPAIAVGLETRGAPDRGAELRGAVMTAGVLCRAPNRVGEGPESAQSAWAMRAWSERRG